MENKLENKLENKMENKSNYYIIFCPNGRLGNGLFRYLAATLYCMKFGLKYILKEDFENLQLDENSKNKIKVINDSNYIDFYTSNEPGNIDTHILLDGYYQFDYIYNLNKDKIINFINSNRDHCVREDPNDYRGRNKVNVYNLINGVSERTYDNVLHLRLDDFWGRIDFIEFSHVEKVLDNLVNSQSFSKLSKNAIVVQFPRTQRDKEVISNYINWFRKRDLDIKLECNDFMTDFSIMRTSTTFISSMSTLAWLAAFFSTSIQTCYMPNYNFYKDRPDAYFRHPVENKTILYDVKTTKFNKTKVIILTLKRSPERLQKLTKLITDMYKVGLTVEIVYGVDGSGIEIKDTENEPIKRLEYSDLRSKFYDRRRRINGELMKKGELGAGWSHLLLYEKLVKDTDYDNYLIFEDDVEMVSTLDKFYDMMCNIPPKFDVLHIAKSDFWPFIHAIKFGNGFNVPYKRFFNRLTAYIVSKEGAQKLLDYSNNSIDVPCDDLLSSSYMNKNLFLFVPDSYLFHEPENTVSVTMQING